VIVGTLLVPVSAVAALLLADPSPTEATPASTTSTTIASPPTATATAGDADLAAACGPAGMQLVALEQGGTISAVQQAALDALRGICEQEGIPLPGKPAPDPVTETVVVASDSPAPGATAGSFEDDEEDHDREDGDEEEHEDEGAEEGHD
jgi:hypothetical protein